LVDFGTQFKTLFQDRIGNALGDVLTRTKSFRAAFKSLIAGIAQDLIRSNISKLIASAFGGALGGANGASGLGTGVTGFNAAFADGGRIYGPGGPREDRVPIMVSPGEWVINAKAVSQLGDGVMQSINAGVLPAMKAFRNGGGVARTPSVPARGFANGGMVSPASASGSGDITIINNSSQPVQARKEVDPKTQLVSLFLEDLNRGGPISRGINGITGTGRKPAY
jgi:hypothetical protein